MTQAARMDDEPDRWPGPDPFRQKLANHTVDDVLALPDDAPRVELVDGVMVVVPSPNLGHQHIQFRLRAWLERHAPLDRFEPAHGVGVAIDLRSTREPDVLLLVANAAQDRHFFAPDQVVLVVEVVSPGTKIRDRFDKPPLYAAAGIPHFWRVEQDPVHVYAYDLGPDGHYKLVADSATELVLAEPFPIRLPVSEITPD